MIYLYFFIYRLNLFFKIKTFIFYSIFNVQPCVKFFFLFVTS
jgi:hypothetical protein